MTARSKFLDPSIEQYIIDTMVVNEHPVMRALRVETAQMPNAQMQIGQEQAQFMQFLTHLLRVERYLEIGVFTGYSALAIALAMPPEGKVVACDVSEEYTSIARRYWKEAGVEKKIDLHVAPALDTLEQLANGGDIGPFDMAFIDADKANVDNYYERSLKLLRRNGVILVDNVLWGGSVADPGENDPDTSALRAISKKAAQDERVEACLLSIGDGLLLARKK
jgi:caffeoyl-CoA O-methyltransferase